MFTDKIETPEYCWEYMHCPEDRKLACRAYLEDCGATCWLIAGTLCKDGEPQGYFLDKLCDCQKCLWYMKRIHGQDI